MTRRIGGVTTAAGAGLTATQATQLAAANAAVHDGAAQDAALAAEQTARADEDVALDARLDALELIEHDHTNQALLDLITGHGGASIANRNLTITKTDGSSDLIPLGTDSAVWDAGSGTLTITHIDGSQTVAAIGNPTILDNAVPPVFDSVTDIITFTWVGGTTTDINISELYDSKAVVSAVTDDDADTITFTALDGSTFVLDLTLMFPPLTTPQATDKTDANNLGLTSGEQLYTSTKHAERAQFTVRNMGLLETLDETTDNAANGEIKGGAIVFARAEGRTFMYAENVASVSARAPTVKTLVGTGGWFEIGTISEGIIPATDGMTLEWGKVYALSPAHNYTWPAVTESHGSNHLDAVPLGVWEDFTGIWTTDGTDTIGDTQESSSFGAQRLTFVGRMDQYSAGVNNIELRGAAGASAAQPSATQSFVTSAPTNLQWGNNYRLDPGVAYVFPAPTGSDDWMEIVPSNHDWQAFAPAADWSTAGATTFGAGQANAIGSTNTRLTLIGDGANIEVYE